MLAMAWSGFSALVVQHAQEVQGLHMVGVDREDAFIDAPGLCEPAGAMERDGLVDIAGTDTAQAAPLLHVG